MIKQGLAIHCHHDILLEYCYDYDERVNAIKRSKPENEQEIRLRLFKMLPKEMIVELPERLVKAYAERHKTYAKWQKAYAERRKAYAKWEKAYAKWGKTDREIWHKKWCGCKEWNVEKIVFKN